MDTDVERNCFFSEHSTIATYILTFIIFLRINVKGKKVSKDKGPIR